MRLILPNLIVASSLYRTSSVTPACPFPSSDKILLLLSKTFQLHQLHFRLLYILLFFTMAVSNTTRHIHCMRAVPVQQPVHKGAIQDPETIL
ncbi:hypothetical protein BDW60DRAFT_175619 [Aspergillus nidulans var. acristatus]